MPSQGYLGDVPGEVWEVVETAWHAPFSIASNYARERALEVAFAASMGWLSTIAPTGRTYTRLWHPTAQGLAALSNQGAYGRTPCPPS